MNKKDLIEVGDTVFVRLIASDRATLNGEVLFIPSSKSNDCWIILTEGKELYYLQTFSYIKLLNKAKV